MALPNLSGSNIQDTFQRVLQTDGSTIYDGTGSAWLTDANGNPPDHNGVVRYNSSGKLIADSGWTFGTFNGSASIMHLQANEINFQTSTGINLGGNISASGTITCGDIINHSNSTSGLRFNPTSTDVLSNLIVSGSTTASGDISSSGMIIGSNLTGSNTGDQDLSSYSTIVQLNASGSTLQTNIDAKAPIASPSFTGAITASGNISSSGTITANTIVIDEGGKFYLDGADPQGNPNTYIHNPGAGDKIEFYVDGGGGDGQKLSIGQSGTLFNNNTITIQGNITASGNISASGDLFFNNIDGGTF
jgi:hypothetical protein